MRPNTRRPSSARAHVSALAAAAVLAPAVAHADQVSFLWNGCGASSCTPPADWQYNHTGAANSVTRLSVGRYQVNLPNSAAAGGTAQVTAWGAAANHCKLESWSTLSTTERVTVRCYTSAGAAVDSGFTVSYQNSEDLLSGTKLQAYLWADQMSAASYAPNATYAWNSNGMANAITRSAAGVYNVVLSGMPAGGEVQVTAYGADAKRCKAATTTASGRNTAVSVRCFNGAAAADSRFTLSYVLGPTFAHAPVGGTLGASFTANQAAQTRTYTPSPLFVNVGTGVTISRLATGVYDARLKGVDGTMASNVLVMATGTANSFCNVEDWWGDGAGDSVARVRCFNANAAATDATFNLMYQTGTHAPDLSTAMGLVNSAIGAVPGMVVAAVKDGAIVYSQAAGMANAGLPATTSVPWQLASLSKVVTATAALQAADQGLLDLDAPATDALDFASMNPWNGAEPTLRHFASHTAGVLGGVCTVGSGGDPSADLGSVLSGCFFSGGAPRVDVWADRQPGVEAEYSNLGATVPARAVEMVMGVDFNTYTHEHIFAPLGMTTAGWFASDYAGLNVLATGYTAAGVPTGEVGISPYPIGNLRASVLDMARFLIPWTSDGFAFGQQILAPGTVAMATSAQYPGAPGTGGSGFVWGPWTTSGGHPVWAQGGVLAGVCNRIDVDPATRSGVVILTNGPCGQAGASINAVENAVFEALDAM